MLAHRLARDFSATLNALARPGRALILRVISIAGFIVDEDDSAAKKKKKRRKHKSSGDDGSRKRRKDSDDGEQSLAGRRSCDGTDFDWSVDAGDLDEDDLDLLEENTGQKLGGRASGVRTATITRRDWGADQVLARRATS